MRAPEFPNLCAGKWLRARSGEIVVCGHSSLEGITGIMRVRCSSWRSYNCGADAGQWLRLRGVHNAAYINMTIPAFQLAIFNSCSFIDREKPWQCRVSLNTLIVNRQTSPAAAPPNNSGVIYKDGSFFTNFSATFTPKCLLNRTCDCTSGRLAVLQCDNTCAKTPPNRSDKYTCHKNIFYC